MGEPRTITRYEVTVWDMTSGDVVDYRRECSEEVLGDLHDTYGDDPHCDVAIDNQWEEELESEDAD